MNDLELNWGHLSAFSQGPGLLQYTYRYGLQISPHALEWAKQHTIAVLPGHPPRQNDSALALDSTDKIPMVFLGGSPERGSRRGLDLMTRGHFLFALVPYLS